MQTAKSKQKKYIKIEHEKKNPKTKNIDGVFFSATKYKIGVGLQNNIKKNWKKNAGLCK